MTSWLKSAVAIVFFSGAVMVRAEVTFYQARIAPILERHCTGCHGAEKQKAKLRLDTLESLLKGAESGSVLKPGSLKESELFRRITLPRDHEDVMPSDGKPLLSADEIKNIELWIADGASATKVLADFPGAPALSKARPTVEPLAPDWRPHSAEIAALARALGVRLIPRSLAPTDGLVLRTASAPGRCDDAALEKLAPVAVFIVEAELARTKVTDAGLKSLVAWENLRFLDLTRTAVTSRGLETMAGIQRIETLNLTDTAVDDNGVAQLKALPSLRRAWLFGTKATTVELPAQVVAK